MQNPTLKMSVAAIQQKKTTGNRLSFSNRGSNILI